MLLRLLATGFMCIAVEPVRAADRDLPADIAREVQTVAIRLDEALTCLKREETLREEALWLAVDLRYSALRCIIRGVAVKEAKQLTDWAEQLERAPASRKSLRVVLAEMEAERAGQRLRTLVAELIRNQERIASSLPDWRAARWPKYDQTWLLDTPRILEVPRIVARRGNSVKVRHGLLWRQYPESTLKIKLVVSSPDLVVPAELTLDFEDHPLDFEYEVRGNVVGEYTITLTPAAGEPVRVSVAVK